MVSRLETQEASSFLCLMRGTSYGAPLSPGAWLHQVVLLVCWGKLEVDISTILIDGDTATTFIDDKLLAHRRFHRRLRQATTPIRHDRLTLEL